MKPSTVLILVASSILVMEMDCAQSPVFRGEGAHRGLTWEHPASDLEELAHGAHC